jgi:hypothetical protein
MQDFSSTNESWFQTFLKKFSLCNFLLLITAYIISYLEVIDRTGGKNITRPISPYPDRTSSVNKIIIWLQKQRYGKAPVQQYSDNQRANQIAPFSFGPAFHKINICNIKTILFCFQEMPPGMRILLSFVQDNRLRLIDWFNQFDKDQSGGISREEFRKGLKETGLVMTTVSTLRWFPFSYLVQLILLKRPRLVSKTTSHRRPTIAGHNFS